MNIVDILRKFISVVQEIESITVSEDDYIQILIEMSFYELIFSKKNWLNKGLYFCNVPIYKSKDVEDFMPVIKLKETYASNLPK